ncbi:phage/plasmid primase, P4 family [Altererythrobacter sp. GH1-8]|uniref:phage/plasmid primase, P4 family n=1 Tax=Altererythrobacter sp. GH1-8 TaxID=3349333 RepID=UPI00374DC3E0
MERKHPLLWRGDFDVDGARRGGGHYHSQSDADLAMAGYIAKSLAHQVASPEELAGLTEGVMGRSDLAQREKWQDRPDYRQRTITKACADVEVQPIVDWSLSGDVRNAKAFARMFRGKMLYVHKGGCWLIWRDERWRRCEKGEELEAAKEVAQELVKRAADLLGDDQDKAKRLIREATQASMRPRLEAMLKLAASEPGMGATPEQLDAHPDMLGVKNGAVNLRMGWLQTNEPRMLITRQCAASFEKTADCPRWRQFLDEVFVNEDGTPDANTIEAVQILLGLTLTGEVSEEIIVFCVGFGANGKSIFGNAISAILGEYAKTAPTSLLAARRTDDHAARPDMAMLPGTRLVSVNELPGGMFLDEVVAKQLAGREPIAARHLYGEYFTFDPAFTPWVRTNHKPIIKGDDDGIWRRIVILPFRRKFERHQQDPFLETKLMAEREGILAWMVEGAVKYYRDGLRLSPAMKHETAQYRKESDLLGEFLEERTEKDPAERVEQSTLFRGWRFWCEENGVQPGSKKTFTQRLAERGFPSTKSNGKRFYFGLKRVGSFS